MQPRADTGQSRPELLEAGQRRRGEEGGGVGEDNEDEDEHLQILSPSFRHFFFNEHKKGSNKYHVLLSLA